MTTLKKKRIGFIGLGSMGKPMAANIARANFPLTVYDVRPEPLAELEKLGAKVAKSAPEVGKESDTVVVMVADYKQIKEAVFPPDGALVSLKSGTTLIITSTIAPQHVEEVAKVASQSGVAVIDSPVSGGREKAEDGSLTLMVGGDEAVIRENEAVLKAMGKQIYHVGKVGQGQAVKLVNQILVCANIISVAEALVMAQKLGLDLPITVNVVSHSAGDSFVLRTMAPRMIARDFAPRSALNIFAKDSRIIMETALALDVPLFVSSQSYQVYHLAEARGLGGQDVCALFKLFGELAGVKDS